LIALLVALAVIGDAEERIAVVLVIAVFVRLGFSMIVGVVVKAKDKVNHEMDRLNSSSIESSLGRFFVFHVFVLTSIF